MPKKLQVYNIGAKGLNSDIASWDLPLEFISYGFNFKVFRNSLISTGGYANWTAPPAEYSPGLVFPLTTAEGYFWIAPGRTAIYAFDGNAWADVGPTIALALNAGEEYLWSHCYLGQIPIINNPQYYPLYWSPASLSGNFTVLPWDATDSWEDRGITAQVIRSHKNFLFALNIQDGATVYPDTYRWSTAADINGLPYTWDEADTAGLAGVAALGGDNGAIIDGMSLRDSFCIYSEYGIDILDYTGGEFIWSRRELSNSVGLFNRNCLVEVEGHHYFLSNGDILKNDGTNITSILRGRIQKLFNESFDTARYKKSFVTKNQNNKEIWFCVPQHAGLFTSDGSFAAYVYNWLDDAWSVRDLPAGVAFAAEGRQTSPSTTWATWTGDWNSQIKPWTSNNSSPLSTGIVCVINSPASLKLLEPTASRDSGDLRSIIARDNFSIEGVNETTTLVKVYPHIKGSGPISIQFGSQLIPYGPIRWKPAMTFNPGIDKKLDIRTTGLFHCWRIDSVGQGSWEFSGMDLEYENCGVR